MDALYGTSQKWLVHFLIALIFILCYNVLCDFVYIKKNNITII